MNPDAKALNAALLRAHAKADGPALCRLYQEAAALTKDTNERAFFLVQAQVFALEENLREAADIHAQLCDLGRDH